MNKYLKNIFSFLVIFGLALGILWIRNQSIVREENSSPPKEGSLTPTPSLTDEMVREIKVTARRFEFEPNEIRVKLGEHIRLKITSEDVTHGLALNEFDINVTLPPQKEVVVEFEANKAGEFPFACSVFCGAGHGRMRGILLVEESS